MEGGGGGRGGVKDLNEDDAASDVSPLSRTSSERSSGRVTRVKDRELTGDD